MIEASKPIVAAIGPGENDRLPAPPIGHIRLTFLVSDGPYFGEGPMETMQSDAMAAPLIQTATVLLLKLVEVVNQPSVDVAALRPQDVDSALIDL